MWFWGFINLIKSLQALNPGKNSEKLQKEWNISDLRCTISRKWDWEEGMQEEMVVECRRGRRNNLVHRNHGGAQLNLDHCPHTPGPITPVPLEQIGLSHSKKAICFLFSLSDVHRQSPRDRSSTKSTLCFLKPVRSYGQLRITVVRTHWLWEVL